MPSSLKAALASASPRLSPHAVPLAGTLIYLAVILLWFGLFARSFGADGLLAWSAGIVYILYDVFLMAFRRDALIKVGGFDPDCLVDHYELTHRLHRYSVEHALGWRLRMVGGAHAVTHAAGTLRTFLTQRRRWFADFLQTQSGTGTLRATAALTGSAP